MDIQQVSKFVRRCITAVRILQQRIRALHPLGRPRSFVSRGRSVIRIFRQSFCQRNFDKGSVFAAVRFSIRTIWREFHMD